MGVLTNRVSDSNYIIPPIHLGSYAITLSTQQLVAVLLILFLTFTNTRGLKTGRLIQNTFTFTKTAALIGLIVIGLLLGWNSGGAAQTSSWWNPWLNGGWNPASSQTEVQKHKGIWFAVISGAATVWRLFVAPALNSS